MGLDHVRSEIEHMRVQLGRQRKEILQLQRAGISTASAELLLQRMLAKIDVPVRRARSAQSRAGWSHERARPRRPELVMREQLKWYDEKAADNSPWLDAQDRSFLMWRCELRCAQCVRPFRYC